jgi:hypothetical protein
MADTNAGGKTSGSDVESPAEFHHQHEMTAGEYAATRVSTLKPPMNKAPNPFKLLTLLSGKQWLFFFVGFFAWVHPPRSAHPAQVLTDHRLGMRSTSSPLA